MKASLLKLFKTAYDIVQIQHANIITFICLFLVVLCANDNYITILKMRAKPNFRLHNPRKWLAFVSIIQL